MIPEKEPERLSAAGTTPDTLRSALHAARGDVPGNKELRALAAALAPQMGPVGGGAGGAGGVGSPAAKSIAARWVLASGVVVTGVALVVAMRAARPEPVEQQAGVRPPAVAELPSTTAPVPNATTVNAPQEAVRQQEPAAASAPPRAEVATPRPAVSAAKGTSAPAGSDSAARPSLPSEVSLLDGARRALPSEPRTAIAWTDRHRALYPSGLLAQEREVIAIEALRRLGDRAGAEQRNREFESKYPTTIHGREIEMGGDAGKK